MKKARFEAVQARLDKYVASSAKDPVLIVRDGEPVAVLIGLGKRNRSPVKLRTVLKRAWLEYEEHGGIPHEEVWTELAKHASKS